LKQAQATLPARASGVAIAALLAVFGAGLFAMGLDQGHIFSLVEGAAAFDAMYLHELSHDVRHAAGFPCH